MSSKKLEGTPPRRALLKGAAITAAGLATPGGLAAKETLKASSQQPSSRKDSRLLDLEKQWLKVEEAGRRNGAAEDAAVATMPSWARPGEDNHGSLVGWPELDRRHPAFRSLDSVG